MGRTTQQELSLNFIKEKDFKIVNLKRLQRQKQWNKIINSGQRSINFWRNAKRE